MVSYARGTLSNRRIDHGWPHQVEIAVPWNGLGVERHAAIQAWLQHHAADHKTRSGTRRPGDGHASRCCFREPAEAKAFQDAFGGTIVSAGLPAARTTRR